MKKRGQIFSNISKKFNIDEILLFWSRLKKRKKFAQLYFATHKERKREKRSKLGKLFNHVIEEVVEGLLVHWIVQSR